MVLGTKFNNTEPVRKQSAVSLLDDLEGTKERTLETRLYAETSYITTVVIHLRKETG